MRGGICLLKWVGWKGSLIDDIWAEIWWRWNNELWRWLWGQRRGRGHSRKGRRNTKALRQAQFLMRWRNSYETIVVGVKWARGEWEEMKSQKVTGSWGTCCSAVLGYCWRPYLLLWVKWQSIGSFWAKALLDLICILSDHCFPGNRLAGKARGHSGSYWNIWSRHDGALYQDGTIRGSMKG